jgi:tetrahydromethanopterin:alpha-L-glutamate ligase
MTSQAYLEAGITPRILLLSDTAGTRADRLLACFEKRGAAVGTTPLSALSFDTREPTGLAIPGFEGQLPHAVLVRSVSAGSFEAITRRLGLLHALGRLSVPVWNSAQSIERCVDKSTTTFLLHQAGLPTPPTFAVEGRSAAEMIARRELAQGPLVLKPLFGAQGRGIRMIRTPVDLPEPDELGDVYYLQHYVARAGPPFRDFRVFVCGGKVLAMMSRRGEDWITNVNRGAVPEPFTDFARNELADLALAAADAVGADFAGVDIVPASDGRLLVLEVNSMPAWSGLQSVAEVDIADAIVAALLKVVAARSSALHPLRVAGSGH